MKLIDLQIKQSLIFENRLFLLLQVSENQLLPKDSIANVLALDANNDIIWTIEPPTTYYDYYSRIFIEDNELYANTSIGQLHHINKETGRVLSSRMIK